MTARDLIHSQNVWYILWINTQWLGLPETVDKHNKSGTMPSKLQKHCGRKQLKLFKPCRIWPLSNVSNLSTSLPRMDILTYLAKAKGKAPINKFIITSNNKLVNTAKKSTASNQLRTRNLSTENLKKDNLDGWYLSLQNDHVILVRGYPVWTAVNNHNMYVQYQVAHSHTG